MRLVIMNLFKIFFKVVFIGHIVLANNIMIDDLDEEETDPSQHDEHFAKDYFVNIVTQNKKSISFISSTLNVFHFDFLMNAYRSMTVTRRTYFIGQLLFEASNLTNPAKLGTDKLITNRMVFVSYQSLPYAVDNYLEVLNVTNFRYKKYDARNKESYIKQGNKFLDQYIQSPQKIVKDNCTIGLIAMMGVQTQWKYPFTNEEHFMKATGKFNFAHDLHLKIDILQIPFKGGEMKLTVVISRDRLYYAEAERLFQRAYRGKFYTQISTVYLPKLAFSVIIKDYSHDSESLKPINTLRCMTQKIVMNINEQGIDTAIKNKPTDQGWDTNDWKYQNYYPPKDACTVDSPFFFTITYHPTNETVLMGKWRPSSGPYVEETVEVSDEA